MSSEVVIDLFNRTFAETEGVRLVHSDGDPVYLPRNENCPYDRICFANGFFSSALHEVAHWCVAGPERRRLVDYGYWYRPDGRTPEEQAEFERVEARPQAIEWIFTVAAGREFHVSSDNLSSAVASVPTARHRFHLVVADQVHSLLEKGLPIRASRFVEVLARQFLTGSAWRNATCYCIFPQALNL